MLTAIAFLLAIGILVAVHEWGHFQMARACGVKVLRFSVGFGPKVLAWTSQRSGTEYALSLIPMGGYVKMLDSREGEVSPAQLPLAFNSKRLSQRAAIVAAGPLANLVLAVLLYSIVNWSGYLEPVAKVSRPVTNSMAARAGFQGGETVLQAAFAGDEQAAVYSFESLRWWLAKAALSGRDLELVYQAEGSAHRRVAVLPLSTLDAREADASLFRNIGFSGPYSPAVLGEIVQGGAAQRAGLLPGDQVLRVGEQTIVDAAQLRELVRESGKHAAPATQQWEVLRSGQTLNIAVTPAREAQAEQSIGRIAAVVGSMPDMVLVRFGFLDGFEKSLVKTWEISSLTVRMFGQMLVGNASLKNISGPVTIADYAGKSARLGLNEFMVFLALISVSLGVINLMPVPVLDGGHLMYFLWEALTGKEVTEAWLNALQKTGVAFLVLLMSIAVFNDIARLMA